MAYSKIISYSNFIEFYEYENDLRFNGRSRREVSKQVSLRSVVTSGSDLLRKTESKKEKRKDNARRSSMVFRRLVSANLGRSQRPLFFSLTYRKSEVDIEQANNNFKAFTESLRSQFSNLRYICVPEFQKRGTIHLHALFWGISDDFAEKERSTRFFAKLWGQGFVDVITTDGDEKLAGYMAKYMAKAFVDQRLRGKKAYRTSRNVLRPFVEKKPFLSPYSYIETGYPQVEGAEVLQDVSFLTQWLGKGRFRLFKCK